MVSLQRLWEGHGLKCLWNDAATLIDHKSWKTPFTSAYWRHFRSRWTSNEMQRVAMNIISANTRKSFVPLKFSKHALCWIPTYRDAQHLPDAPLYTRYLGNKRHPFHLLANLDKKSSIFRERTRETHLTGKKNCIGPLVCVFVCTSTGD